ncbi:MAG: hypothetical protein HC872_04765 [Gammaproteobacteria bacterium]|nr:hypothetical protein [Gammaproteobacteria bacterium]
MIVSKNRSQRAILAFQIEMLSDPALVEEVLPLIAGGEPASAAWAAGLAGQIAAYEAADDDYFQARASDLRDLQDRVLRALEGATIELPDVSRGALLFADDLAPSLFLALAAREPGGIALVRGSASSQVWRVWRAHFERGQSARAAKENAASNGQRLYPARSHDHAQVPLIEAVMRSSIGG